ICSGKLCLGRCGSCDLEHRQMDDGWGLHFVRRTRKSELSGRNQSPFGTLGSKPQELVAPSGCCLGSGIDTRRSERVGSSKQGYNDQTHFCPPFSLPIVTRRHCTKPQSGENAASRKSIHSYRTVYFETERFGVTSTSRFARL